MPTQSESEPGTGEFLTSKPSMKDGSRRLSCSSTADQRFQLSKSLTPLSPRRFWSASSRTSSRLKLSTTYSGVSDQVQHIRYFRDKMVIYSRNDPMMCFTFPCSLKGVASYWFYSLPPHSLHSSEVFQAFLTQYASQWETKRNNRYLLTVKIRQRQPQSYIGYFQSQLAKVPNCTENIFALAFISGLQVSPHVQASSEARHPNEQGSIPSSTLHLVRGGNEDFLQPLREAR